MKIKRILFILIATVALVATLSINSFAFYFNGSFYEAVTNIPNVTSAIQSPIYTSEAGVYPPPSGYVVRYVTNDSYLYYSRGNVGSTSPSGSTNVTIRTVSNVNSLTAWNDVGLTFNAGGQSDSNGVFVIKGQTFYGGSSFIDVGNAVIGGYNLVDSNGDYIIPREVFSDFSIMGGTIDYNGVSDSTINNYYYYLALFNFLIDVIVVDPLNNVTYTLSFRQGQIDFTLNQSLLPFIESKLYDDYGVVLSNTFLFCDGIRVNTLKTDFNDADTYRGFIFSMTFNEAYQQMTNHLEGVNQNSLETPFNIALESISKKIYDDGYEHGYIVGFEDGIEDKVS